ncbi:MAG TPA: FHA domain-containing protein [Anaerolineales bacterium]
MGKDQDYLVIVEGPNAGEKIYLTHLPLTLGRVQPADVVINVESVSRNHARIQGADSHYRIEDLGSRNGTYVNNQKLNAPCELSNGDLIQLGPDAVLRVVVPAAGQEGSETIMEALPASDKTVIMTEAPTSITAKPPQLVVNEAGKDPRVFNLTADRVRIGRLEDNDIVLSNQFVSRHHAELERRGADYYLIPSSNISNSLILDGQPVMEPVALHHGAKIRIGGYAPSEIVTLDYLSPEKQLGGQRIRFSENKIMRIGRNPDNDIVLPAPTVSQYHAEVEKIGQRYRLHDLRSSNGTFLNGKSVSGETWVHPGDAIQIGPYRFAVDQDELAQSDQSEGGVRVEMLGLNKRVSRGLNILQDISLVFEPKEFIVVVGQSGGGKTTLVDAIAGYRPATQGKVIVNETIDVYKEFDAIRPTIGYVPQKDIIHMELTVFQALDYAARLRMPVDTTREERHKRIEEVMKDLDLSHRKDTQISRLSGGQQKRVSIGVELLTKPGLFFLDEPTSGLDPGMETELMHLMRRLADQGRTIIMITHATKNVMLADKVVFLARGGYLAWFGPPEEALTYFDQYRSERDRRSTAMEFDHIYTLLDREELGSGADWAKRYKNDAAYQTYIAKPLADKLPGQKKQLTKPAGRPVQRARTSALRQFLILSDRNIKIMTRDRFSLILLILIAPIMASLDFVLAYGVGHNPTGFVDGAFNQYVVTLISLTNTSVLVGGLAMMRELVKEREIYKRERRVNLQLSSYIMSKAWIALVLAVYQAICFTVIRYIAFQMPGGREEMFFFFVTEFLLVLAGTMVGLFASALAPNANSAPLLLILFVIPQMVLSGALVQLPNTETAIASMRWAFQAFVGISGVGSDVAGDSCWNKTPAQQDQLTLDYKNANCTCMGENALRQNSCNFPGLGKYYVSAIDQIDPVKPAAPGPQPAQPQFPAAPAQPADPNSLLALQSYLKNLTAYNQQVDSLRSQYQSQVTAWQNDQNTYKTAIQDYETSLTNLKVSRATAVGSAESTIRRFKDQYGWTFLNKKDRSGYLKTLFGTWGAQLLICLVLFAGTVIFQRRWESAA